MHLQGQLLSLCAASRMWARHRSVVIVPPEGVLESRWDAVICWCFLHFTSREINSLGTPRSTERPDHICTTIQSDGVTQGLNRSVRPSRVMEPFKEWTDQCRPSVGKRVKCRMKCFYETRSRGPQDQDFDVILI